MDRGERPIRRGSSIYFSVPALHFCEAHAGGQREEGCKKRGQFRNSGTHVFVQFVGNRWDTYSRRRGREHGRHRGSRSDFTRAEILVPGVSDCRSGAVAVSVVALYGLVIVVGSFYV